MYEDDTEDTPPPPATAAAALRPLPTSTDIATPWLAKPTAPVASHPEAAGDDGVAAEQRDPAPAVTPEAPTDHLAPAATPEPMDQDRQPAAPAAVGHAVLPPTRGKRRRDRRTSGDHAEPARKRQVRPTAAAASAADVPPGAADWTSEETHGGLLDRPLRLGRRPLWMRTLAVSLFDGLLDSGVALGKRRGTRKLRAGVHL